MTTLEQEIDDWFYKYATEEPDGTHTLVMHEVHDNGARDDLEALIEAEVVSELEKLKEEQHLETENNGTMYYSVDVEVIDNRISELKGKGEV